MCFIHVLLVLYMPMDASLACWALFSLFFLSFVICLVSDTYLVSDARAFPGRPGKPAKYALGWR